MIIEISSLDFELVSSIIKVPSLSFEVSSLGFEFMLSSIELWSLVFEVSSQSFELVAGIFGNGESYKRVANL